MPRLPFIDPDAAGGRVADPLAEYAERSGNPPGPMVRGTANSSTENVIQLARQSTATDARTAAIVAFGRQVIAAPSRSRTLTCRTSAALGWD